MEQYSPNWRFLIMICLTLGLAPFYPEPHILGKIKWLMGGANGMGFMDWFDVVLHGTPWLLLIGNVVYVLLKPSGASSQ